MKKKSKSFKKALTKHFPRKLKMQKTKEYLEDHGDLSLSNKLNNLINLNRYYQMRASETNVHRPLEDYTDSDSNPDFNNEERAQMIKIAKHCNVSLSMYHSWRRLSKEQENKRQQFLKRQVIRNIHKNMDDKVYVEKVAEKFGELQTAYFKGRALANNRDSEKEEDS